jgi:hypothetical protein
MGFYELRSAMGPLHFVKRASKVVGGEQASIAHPWDLWGVGRIFAKDKDRRTSWWSEVSWPK